MPGPALQAVILDFGGVVALPSQKVLATFPARFGVTLEEFRAAVARAGQRIRANPMAEIESGRMTEAQFKALVEAELPPGAHLNGFAEGYYEHLQPNLRMIAYASALRHRGLRTALVTNSAPEWAPLWRAQVPGLEEAFDVAVDSGSVGARKPDRAIYDELLRRLAVPAWACVFVDDKEENCAMATQLGMEAILFRGTGETITALEALVGSVSGAQPG